MFFLLVAQNLYKENEFQLLQATLQEGLSVRHSGGWSVGQLAVTNYFFGLLGATNAVNNFDYLYMLTSLFCMKNTAIPIYLLTIMRSRPSKYMITFVFLKLLVTFSEIKRQRPRERERKEQECAKCMKIQKDKRLRMSSSSERARPFVRNGKTLYSIISHHVQSSHVTSRHFMSRPVTSRYVTLRHIMLCRVA